VPGRVVAGLAIFWLVGCAATGSLKVGALAWSESGSIDWSRGETSVSAGFHLGADASGNLVLTVKNPGKLIEIMRSGDAWSATGPIAGPGWTGPRENAPLALAGWLTLAETLAYTRTAPDQVDGIASGNVRARWDKNRAEIITAETGEQFRVLWK
jgi:hypothetical protein